MVDFAKHLKNGSSEKPENLNGTLASWVLAVGGVPEDAQQVECAWEIVEEENRTWFSLRTGGVTGYESFGLEDDRGINLHVLSRFGNPKGSWTACAGTLNSWKQQKVAHEIMMPILLQWLKKKDIIVRCCMHCWNGLGTIPAEGGGGGWSHTICDDCSEE